MTTSQLEKFAARMALLALLPDDALLNCREVCAFLSRSKTSIYRDIEAGRLAAPIKVGSSSRWKLGDVRAIAG